MRHLALPVLVATAAITGAAAPLPLAVAQPLTAVQGQLLITALPAGSHDLRLDGQPVHLEGDGRFMLGVDRDFAGTKALEWVTNDGRSARRDLVVTDREWVIDRLPARLGLVTWVTALRDLEYEARREAEVAQVKAARAKISPWPFWRAPFQWPATGRISTHFGAQRVYGDIPASYHGGMDIAAPHGTPVKAPIPGVVRLAAGPFMLEGNIIIIDHGRGLHSAMMHLSKIEVKPGDIVAQGQVIGRIGSTGRSTGPHLHWGMTWHGVKVDPEALLPPMPAKDATGR
ncbi:M23 family metallopeptidase [Sandarakinorhabdus limnophila]|uniref:M23 family metallopeptidase n=1 Tax=Sandarakinorhabdus limnophila TaxID=210512 RepID=UPI0026ED1E30|nr:M23 family metallopeptidase [Sandarakinorhabdus limnophila]